MVYRSLPRGAPLAPHRRNERISQRDPAIPAPQVDDCDSDEPIEWRARGDRRADRRSPAVSLALDPVPEGAYRHDVARVGGIVLELAPQHRDVRVDRSAHDILGVAPHFAEQLEPARDPPAALQ